MVHFFCEYCEKEVRAKDKICPHCRKLFSHVSCPQCEYRGSAEHFLMGCPGCGYTGGGKLEAVYEEVDLFDRQKLPIYFKRYTGVFPDWLFALVGIFFFVIFMIAAFIFFVSR